MNHESSQSQPKKLSPTPPPHQDMYAPLRSWLEVLPVEAEAEAHFEKKEEKGK